MPCDLRRARARKFTSTTIPLSPDRLHPLVWTTMTTAQCLSPPLILRLVVCRLASPWPRASPPTISGASSSATPRLCPQSAAPSRLLTVIAEALHLHIVVAPCLLDAPSMSDTTSIARRDSLWRHRRPSFSCHWPSAGAATIAARSARQSSKATIHCVLAKRCTQTGAATVESRVNPREPLYSGMVSNTTVGVVALSAL